MRKQKVLLLFLISIVILSFIFISCDTSQIKTTEVETTATTIVETTTAKTKATVPTMKVLINGQTSFAFSKIPIFDGDTLWLPGSEVMRLYDYQNIYIDERYVSCGYFDNQGEYKNSFYEVGKTGYSINTDDEEFVEASQAPYSLDGEIYIPEDAMEAMTGDVFVYDPNTQTLNMILDSYIELQKDNHHDLNKIVLKKPYELNDNRISDLVSNLGACTSVWDKSDWEYVAKQSTGWTWISATINNQDWYEDNWEVPDLYLDDTIEKFYQTLDECGMKITYNLIFKDKEYLGISNREGQGSLRDPAQVDRYLEFIKEVVTHFKGVVDCYEIWNESNIRNSPQYVAVEDYIAIVKKAYPLIKSIDPDAIVSIGQTTSFQEDDSWEYTDKLVSSDAVQYADRITIHPFLWISPEHYPEYYYDYPQIVTEMKEKAIQNGFHGEFWGSEGNYKSVDNTCTEDCHIYSETVSTKYLQRVNAMNIGLGLSGGVMGTNTCALSVNALGRSALLLSGVKAADYGITVNTDVEPTRSSNYDVDMGRLFTYWNDGIASDSDQFSYCDIILNIDACEHVYAYDVLSGFYIELDYSIVDDQINIHNVIIKDYPIYILVN